MNGPAHSANRRGILLDGLVVGCLCLTALVFRVQFDEQIGETRAVMLAHDLAKPVLGLLTIGCLALWAVMAVRGADNSYQRWTARFVFGWVMVSSALWFGWAGYPLYSMTVMGVVIWSCYGMGGAMIERYFVGRIPWKYRLFILGAFVTVIVLLVIESVRSI
jgi:hypothetical protein